GGAPEHHAQGPFAGGRGRVPVGEGRYLLSGGAGHQHLAGGADGVVLPPAAEGEGTADAGGLAGLAVDRKVQRELRADLGFHAQQVQHQFVAGGFVGTLGGQGAGGGGAEIVGRFLRLHVADLHVGLIERRVGGVA